MMLGLQVWEMEIDDVDLNRLLGYEDTALFVYANAVLSTPLQD
jgi:hypothetical protein